MKPLKPAGAVTRQDNSPRKNLLKSKCKDTKNISQNFRIIRQHFGLQSILFSYLSSSERAAL
jgi:hypothetical protein